MHYLLLCSSDEDRWYGQAQAERDELMVEIRQWADELKREGRLVGGAKLDRSGSAAIVRLEKGHPSVTDGPYTETKEQLGGYHLLACGTMDEAIAIAKTLPSLRAGGVIEVRRVDFLE